MEYARTTLNLNSKLLAEIMKMSGIKEKTKIIEEALQVYRQKLAMAELVKLGGSMPGTAAPERRRRQKSNSEFYGSN